MSGKTLGVLAVLGLVVAFSLSSTLVKRAESPGVLVAFWRMVVVSVAMPALFALGWVPTTAIGVDVEEQFTVFGAAGALLFMLASGLTLAAGSNPGSTSSATEPKSKQLKPL